MSGEFVGNKKGTIVENRGYGMLVKQCASVLRYKVYDKRSVPMIVGNKTVMECFNNLPVKSYENEKIYFVDPTSLVLRKYGSRRNCKSLPPVLLFKDMNEKMFKLTRKGRWIKAVAKGQMINSSNHYPKLHVFNRLLSRNNKPKIPRLTLLDAIQDTMDVVDSMSQLGDGEREALNKVLGNKEGLLNLEELSKKGKAIMKSVSLSLGNEPWKVVKPIIIYVAPLVAIILFILF